MSTKNTNIVEWFPWKQLNQFAQAAQVKRVDVFHFAFLNNVHHFHLSADQQREADRKNISVCAARR